MFASPDNPTGALLDYKQLLSWCTEYPNTLFVVDEAYTEFSGISLADRVLDYDNLLVVRTLSKAWGLAGLRVGIVLGQADLIKHLRVVRLPYSVNSVAVSVAQHILTQQDRVRNQARQTMIEKDLLIDELRERGYKVVAGAGNFFLLGVGFNAKEMTEFLRNNSILVRDRSKGRNPADNVLWGFLRITVGTKDENRRLLEAIDTFNARYAVSFDLDGTLVDTTQSYDATIDLLVTKYSGSALNDGELVALRSEGKFNNDWDAAEEILRRRGITLPRHQLEAEAVALYFNLAKKYEKLLIVPHLLSSLRKRHPVFIITGRPRREYEPLWGQTFDPLCNKVYCADDIPAAQPKPAPDHFNYMLGDHNLSTGVYVGNSVDDMKAAQAAGLQGIGISTTLSAQQLETAGAQIVLDSPNSLDKVFLL